MTEIQRIVLTGGGTGGHIYPALALYRRFIQQYPKAQVLYIGTERGLESKIVPQEGIPFETIDIEGLRRSLSPKNLQVAFKMLTATHKAKKILKDFKPDLVLGTGGFVCGPVLLGAAQLKIPTKSLKLMPAQTFAFVRISRICRVSFKRFSWLFAGLERRL